MLLWLALFSGLIDLFVGSFPDWWVGAVPDCDMVGFGWFSWSVQVGFV